MKTAAGLVIALLCGAFATGIDAAAAHAADAKAPAADAVGTMAPTTAALDAAASAAGAASGEPNVRRTVIEDDRTRIEELRVRGRVQTITVDPKGRAPAYQIVTGEGPPDFADGVGSARGAAGKRVWNVFRF